MNQKIKKDLENYLIKKINQKKISYTTDLIAKSIIDSFGIVELINFIEKKYNIKINSNDMIPPHFKDINNITKLILKKLNEIR